MPDLRPTHAVFALLTLALLLVGCNSSQDKHVFYSLPETPLNVAVRDSFQRQQLWYYEIPVQHKLELDFKGVAEVEHIKADPRIPASSFRWKLFKLGTAGPNLGVIEEGVVQLPGTAVMMEVTLRPAPELPPDSPLLEKQ